MQYGDMPYLLIFLFIHWFILTGTLYLYFMQNEFNQMDLSKREQKVHVLNKGFLWKDLWYAMSPPGKNICPLNLCAKHGDDSSSVTYKLILNEDGLPCQREFRSTLLHVLLSFSGNKNHPFFAPPLPPPDMVTQDTLVSQNDMACGPEWPLMSESSVQCKAGKLRMNQSICFFADPVSDIFQHMMYLRSICKEGNRQLANYRNTFEAF